MRLLTILAASAVLRASTLPTLALDAAELQAAYDGSELSESADITLWCAVAFQFVATQATKQSMTDEAAAYTAKSDLLYARAETLLNDEDLSQEDVATIGQAYGYAVNVQMADTSTEPDHSEEECEAEAARP